MAGKRAGRTCTVCGNSQRQAIEHAIVDGVKSKRAIGAEFGIGRTALAHHVAKHMTAGLKKTIVKHAELVGYALLGLRRKRMEAR